jgi:D-alanyl-D-alanine dipeptidase
MKRWLLLLTVCLIGCGGRNNSGQAVTETVVATFSEESSAPSLSPTARKLDSLGYVNVVSLDPSMAVHIVYATPDNFVGETMYDDLVEAYLLPEAAEKLIRAHELLKEKHPEYRFILYDAARPMAVQRKMWDVAVKTGKQYYVANPAKGGGLHNYGAAVDLSILDGNGMPLPMGTEYDHLGPEANIDKEQALVSSGKLTESELQNRLLLREVMRAAGFRTVTSEWWHFNHCSREEAIKNYPLIDF